MYTDRKYTFSCFAHHSFTTCIQKNTSLVIIVLTKVHRTVDDVASGTNLCHKINTCNLDYHDRLCILFYIATSYDYSYTQQRPIVWHKTSTNWHWYTKRLRISIQSTLAISVHISSCQHYHRLTLVMEHDTIHVSLLTWLANLIPHIWYYHKQLPQSTYHIIRSTSSQLTHPNKTFTLYYD